MTVDVNGVTIYYEVYNSGQPLIFLHGNGESMQIFNNIPKLITNHQIYLIDSRNHGKSSSTKNISYDLMADDIALFIQKLKLKKPILVGFSDGAIVSMLIAIKYPTLLDKQILMGGNINPHGLKIKWRVLFKITYFFSRSKLLKMMLKEPHISKDDLKKITIPTLVLAGQKDIISYSHTTQIARTISNATLKIIVHETHMSYVTDNNKLLANIKDFIS